MLNNESLDQCLGPVWQVDDISKCVQHKYLKIIFPSSAAGISFLLLLSKVLQHSLLAKRSPRKQHKTYSNRPTLSSEENEDHERLMQDTSRNEDFERSVYSGARLILGKSTTDGIITAIDVPRGKYTAQILEIIALLLVDTLNFTVLVIQSAGHEDKSAFIASIITWIYITIIVFSRFALSMTSRRIPSLWNHTVLLYTFMWFLSLITFRSALIHPRPRMVQITVISEFLLITFVFLISITTRKGNKTVLMQWENNIEPSREPLASILSLVTFTWVDVIVWKGYKKVYELPEVWNLVPQDKAANVLAQFRQLKKTTALSWRLLRFFKKSLFLQCFFAVISGIFTFAPTLLLKSILEYLEDPTSAPRNVIWLIVILLAFTDILRSFAEGQSLWIGRKVCIRLRAIIIGELYAKALRRKAASVADNNASESKSREVSARSNFLKKIFKLDKKQDITERENIARNAKDSSVKPTDEQSNVGTIINLMSVDSFKVSEITAYLHYLLAAAPTQLILAVYLLYQILGYSSIPGFIAMIILLPINFTLARGFGRYQKKIMNATDKRIHTTNELLQNIRIVKYFAWEQRFGKIMNDKRNVELNAIKTKFRLWAVAVAVWNTVPIFITFFSFLVYTTVEKKPLYPSVAFTAISLFNILRVPLDQLGDMIAHVLESKVSVDRVERFLNEEETEKYNQLRPRNSDEGRNDIIGFKNATVSWKREEMEGEEASLGFCLMDLDIKFEIGMLNIIVGPTGSGKTSLLMALLGEMTLLKGEIFLPGGYSREDIRPDPRTGLTDSVAFCAQQAWLVNTTIKDNILFAAEYDEKRYEDVIAACALERDLKILDAGDQTLVGEKGIALSGGQKQRISLARALYSNSKHVLLDDCLSAVDSHTAKWIFEKCISGPLMQGRTCILVTHNLALCLHGSKYVVVLDNGKVSAQGKPHEVIASGMLGNEMNKSRTEFTEASKAPISLDVTIENTLTDETSMENDHKSEFPKNDRAKEIKATGGMKFSVLLLYIQSMGSWWFWIISIMIFGAQQFGALAGNTWIRQWANQYSTESLKPLYAPNLNSLKSNTILSHHAVGYRVPSVISYFGHTKFREQANSAQDVNVIYYLSIYAVIGLSYMLIALFRDLWLFFGSITASRQIHQRLVQSVIRAKFGFFDVTPLGQLMNRFSKDLQTIDQEVAPISIGMMSCILAILVTIALVTFITPLFLFAAIPIGLMYVFVSMFYLRSSRDLKRIESVQRSPLFQHFGETLNGIVTIRAFGDEKRFTRENLLIINTHNRPFIYLWATNRWLSFRMDLIGDLVAFAAAALVVMSIGKIDAGSAGLSLTYAISFTENMLWLTRLYALNEQNMNSVERIKEYLEVEQEADAVIEETKPAPNWPSQGSIEFINYTTRYRKDLDPVLKNISFKIRPGEKVGIVGRTGAGKSSLALALFRGLEAEKGKILIDEVDIGLIGLQDLRESITIVPQDPTLFSGTIRSNLDPFDLFSDEEIITALRRVHLIPAENSLSSQSNLFNNSCTKGLDNSNIDVTEISSGTSTPKSILTNKNIFLDLSSPITESGSNLSQGQRQLLCLARALLKNPTVLMMDEATASIDYLTDRKIQTTIHELTSTIITIAHRLHTIVDYDKVLVLDNGEIVEFGHPWVLLREDEKKPGTSHDIVDGSKEDYAIKTGTFREMCEINGELDELAKIAKKAWDNNRLIDYGLVSESV
ncbi:ATP-dependent bile acid permease [Golovinomyces cichoracearum]|uniref:ATP-dependent bile acid permease n=1 Tax=Golovinomyces cichoracearum TaxID=62708 RepID=A0A420IFD3_9PEZI|nr:ATP-dependent bile acid permease [Golovinomyces cichoracearum]